MFNKKGYIGQKMSVRAFEAYNGGKKPLTYFSKNDIVELNDKLVELGYRATNLKVWQLKEFLKSFGLNEWHHTSKFFNETNFYSIAEILSDGDVTDTEELNKDSIVADRLNSLYDYESIENFFKKPIIEKTNIEYAEIVFAEWAGTRNHPKKIYRHEQAIICGEWAYLIGKYQKKSLKGSELRIKKRFSRKPKHFNNEETEITKKYYKLGKKYEKNKGVK